MCKLYKRLKFILKFINSTRFAFITYSKWIQNNLSFLRWLNTGTRFYFGPFIPPFRNLFFFFKNTSPFHFSSVAQSCPTLCDPMNCSMAGLPVHHHLPEFTQTHVHRVGDATQPSHPLWSPFPPAPNPSQHQSLFQWVNSSHEVAKVLEFQL